MGVCEPIGLQANTRCLNLRTVNSFVHKLVECPDAKYYLVVPHNLPLAEIAGMTAAEYRRGFVDNDVYVFAVTPTCILPYLSDVKKSDQVAVASAFSAPKKVVAVVPAAPIVNTIDQNAEAQAFASAEAEADAVIVSQLE